MDLWLAGQLLLLLMVANGAPILARNLFGNQWEQALDGGYRLPDGRPVFGPSKTWRGVFAALLTTPIAALLLGLSSDLGLLIAALSMAGDLLSSFLKRRLGIASSDMALGLDQIPEALLPLALVGRQAGLDWPMIVGLTLVFLVLELLLSRVLYILKIRKRPY